VKCSHQGQLGSKDRNKKEPAFNIPFKGIPPIPSLLPNRLYLLSVPFPIVPRAKDQTFNT
jgi:hypothetical protein